MSIRLSTGAMVAAGSGVAPDGEAWLIDIDPATTVAELAESIGVAPAAIMPGLAEELPLLEAGIRSGADLPVPPTLSRTGALRLEVVGGPFAGETIPLQPDTPLRIGSSSEMELCIADPFLADHHATLTVRRDRRPDGSTGSIEGSLRLVRGREARSNGEIVSGEASLGGDDLFQIGSLLLRIGAEPESNADLAQEEPGLRGFNRPSRIKTRSQAPTVVLPGDRPEEQDKTPLPWLSALMPVVLGVTMAIVFGRAIMLIMAAASPIMVVGSFLMNRKRAERKGQRTLAQWKEDVESAQTRLTRLIEDQREDAWKRHPDPVAIGDIAAVPLERLWERRRSDPDALELRVGVAEVDLEVRFEGGGQQQFRLGERRVGVTPSPVAVDLAAGPLGIAGAEDVIRSAARSLLCSIATLRSPLDATLVVLCDESDALHWSWVHWLPHAQAGTAVGALIGNTEETRRDRMRWLRTQLEGRLRAVGERGGSALDASHIIVLVDGARRFRTLQGMTQLLEAGSAVGMHVIAIDSDRARLPEEAAAVVEVDPDDRSLARVQTAERETPTLLLDGLSIAAAERIARSLCGITHVSGVGDDAILPNRVRLLDLLGIDLDDPAALATRWEAVGPQVRAVVGADGEGPFEIDLALQGPHALIAGTTGSGKSEFLKTFVAALALRYRPDALTFFLVDFKGNSAFAECSELPHTVGNVTNLDAREAERALASLRAELYRRQERIRELAEKDLESAWRAAPERAAAAGLARLAIVVDEFAELRSELPGFIEELVRIARVGRSLGVHLVLATQRPSGVVTPEMQSNIGLRVALRVADRADSSDVLGTVDAALISAANPGRAFLRAEAGGSPLPFQTASVGGVRPGLHRVRRVLPPAARLSWRQLGQRPQFPEAAATGHEASREHTDLRGIVELAHRAAERLGLGRNAPPWLPPLPRLVTAAALLRTKGLPSTVVAVGLLDVPERQAQEPLFWDLAVDGDIAVYGSPRSGRTSALRSLVGQAIEQLGPEDLHVYAIDYGNGGLAPLAEAPHCGAVVAPTGPDRLPRLMHRLTEELSARLAALELGYPSIEEQRRAAAPGLAMPYLLLAIDGWDRVQAQLSAEEWLEFRDQVLRLLREGAAAGIKVIVTGDRTFPNERIASHFELQFALPLRDVSDHRLGGGRRGDQSAQPLPEGRALFGTDQAELQFAVLGEAAPAEAQTARLRELVTGLAAAPEPSAEPQDQAPLFAARPIRIDALPGALPASEAAAYPLAGTSQRDWPVVGIGGDTLSRITVDWPELGGMLVLGERQSGRSTALAFLAEQFAEHAVPLLVAAVEESPLSEVARRLRLPLLGSIGATAEQVAKIADKALAAAKDGSPLTVLVDDVEGLRDSTIDAWMRAHSTRLAPVVAADIHALTRLINSPSFMVARTAQAGLVLSPTSTQVLSAPWGVQIPKPLVGRRARGRALLYIAGEFIPVQLPEHGR